jgi:thermitase
VLAAAPDATILPVRVLDDEGWGTDLAIASGISYAVEHGASVVNMSLVVPGKSPIVRDAVRAAQSRGVVIVTASGTKDDGLRNDWFLTRRSICVGAPDSEDIVADWCLVGPFVHVFAPGVELAGAIGGSVPNSYGRWSGVSFSVPLLSAGAAMIREKHPRDWTARQVRDALRYPSAPTWFPTGSHVAWRGRVDLNLSVPSY